MEPPSAPFRLLDPSGRNLVWVKINSERASIEEAVYNSDDCRIVLCTRISGPGSPQDLTRPCFKGSIGAFFRLRDEVHEWLENLNFGQKYQLEFRFANDDPIPGWHVGFYPWNSDIAALFKLTWGSDV